MRKACFACVAIVILMIISFNTRCEAAEAAGKIDQFNTKFMTIVIKTDGEGFQVLSADEKTSLTNKAGKSIKFTELKKGDYVSVVYDTVKTGNSSKNLLKSVKVSEEKQKRKK